MSAARLSTAETYQALHDGVVGRVTERDVVRVAGPDAVSYVQGQVSQDVASLAPGQSAEALLLSVQGKLEVYVRVTLLGPEELLVDVEPGWGDVAFERLRRFKIRVKADLEQATWRLAELRGPASAAALAAAGLDAGAIGAVPIPVAWPGLVGIDLLGPSATLPDGVPEGDEAAFEAARIEAGQPRMGSELTDRTDRAGGRRRRADGQLHEGLLHRPGARGTHRLTRQPRPAAAARPRLRRVVAGPTPGGGGHRGDRREGGRRADERGLVAADLLAGGARLPAP